MSHIEIKKIQTIHDMRKIIGLLMERLSGDEYVWQKFGTFISDEFKSYINEEVLKWNLMMLGIRELGG